VVEKVPAQRRGLTPGESFSISLAAVDSTAWLEQLRSVTNHSLTHLQPWHGRVILPLLGRPSAAWHAPSLRAAAVTDITVMTASQSAPR